MDGSARPDSAAERGPAAIDAAVELFVCDTCRYRPDQRECESRSGGVHFAEHLERQLNDTPIAGVHLRRVSCLMACSRHCTVHVRSAGKFGYLIGDFTPDASSAMTLLAYVDLYRQSDTGQVPYRSWPQAIKGHFIARTPP
jgi:predicted metal-binding protein